MKKHITMWSVNRLLSEIYDETNYIKEFGPNKYSSETIIDAACELLNRSDKEDKE